MLTLGAVSAPHLQCRWPGHPRVTSARGWGETGQRSLGKEQGPQVCPAPPPPVSPPSAQPVPWPTSPLGSVLVVTHQGPQASAPTQAAAPSHCDQVCPGKPSHRLGPAARWPELGRQVGTLGRRVLGGHQGTLKSLLQHHSSKASILWCSAFFTVHLSHPYMTTGKTIALTR